MRFGNNYQGSSFAELLNVDHKHLCPDWAELTRNFAVEGIWPAVIGSLVISVISMLLSVVLKDEKKKS